MYMKCDLSTFDLSSLGSKFDVILIEPPLEEYQRRTSGITYSWEPWDFEEVTVGGALINQFFLKNHTSYDSHFRCVTIRHIDVYFGKVYLFSMPKRHFWGEKTPRL